MPRVLLNDTTIRTDDAIAIAEEVDGHLGPIGTAAWAWDVSAIHSAGRVVHAWVINEGWQLDVVEGMGVDGVFTDFPERALARRGRAQEDDVVELLSARGLR